MKRLTSLALFAALLVAASVAAEDTPAKPEVGKAAPEFDLSATSVVTVLPKAKDQKTLSLKDLKGKNVVLFFYPRAMTKGCTIESCGFRDKVADFAKLDTVIVGISYDTVEDQQKFTDKEKLTFPLLADTEKKVAKAYGTFSEKAKGPTRHTFVIDKKGVLRKAYQKVTPAAHPAEVLKFVETELK